MWGRSQNEEEVELEGYALMMAAYRVANSYVSRIKSEVSEATIAVGIGATEEDARKSALNNARKRLILMESFDLMVGG